MVYVAGDRECTGRRDGMRTLDKLEAVADWCIDHPVRLICVALALMVVIGYVSDQYEKSNPCIKRGPREVAYWNKIGDMMYPVYHEPCLQRER